MPKRLLDCCASDFRSFTKSDLLESIQKSEGRVIACETIGTVQPLLGNVTNAEFAASMGADILLLNMFDVQHPVINGLPETEPENTVRMLKKLTGRPIGINLEPVAEGEEGETDPIRRCAGRSRREHPDRGRHCRLHRRWCRHHPAASPRHGAGHHDGVRPRSHQLRTPSRRTDHHGHRHLAGGRGHGHHPPHCADVQNGRH